MKQTKAPWSNEIERCWQEEEIACDYVRKGYGLKMKFIKISKETSKKWTE